MRLHRFYIGSGKAKNKAQNGGGNSRDDGQKPLSNLDISSKITLDSGTNDNNSSLIHQWRDVFRYTAGSRVVLFDDSKTECLCMIESLSLTRAELVLIEKNGPSKNAAIGASGASGLPAIAGVSATPADDNATGLKKSSKKSKLKNKGNEAVSPKKVRDNGKKPDLSAMGKVIDMNALGLAGMAATFESPFASDEDGSENGDARGENAREIWLLASIVKNDNFDLIIQKTTELGVDHIVPVISDRTIKKDINMKRAIRIAIEASEQSGRMSVPTIHEPIAMKKAIENLMSKGGEVVVCTQHGKNWNDIRSFLKKYPIGFVVGPEGGWSEREEAYFKTSGLKMTKIGENVLRAETAAIAMITLVKIK